MRDRITMQMALFARRNREIARLGSQPVRKHGGWDGAWQADRQVIIDRYERLVDRLYR